MRGVGAMGCGGRLRSRAEKANDLPIWEVVSTRGEWAGVLPENYYEQVQDALGGVHGTESATSWSNRQPQMSPA